MFHQIIFFILNTKSCVNTTCVDTAITWWYTWNTWYIWHIWWCIWHIWWIIMCD